MSMTKKDFEKFADGFAKVRASDHCDFVTLAAVVREFCNVAETINPNFDRAKFVQRCAGQA